MACKIRAMNARVECAFITTRSKTSFRLHAGTISIAKTWPPPVATITSTLVQIESNTVRSILQHRFMYRFLIGHPHISSSASLWSATTVEHFAVLSSKATVYRGLIPVKTLQESKTTPRRCGNLDTAGNYHDNSHGNMVSYNEHKSCMNPLVCSRIVQPGDRLRPTGRSHWISFLSGLPSSCVDTIIPSYRMLWVTSQL